MPIRFRCPFCNQLMGIARRKAGTVVRCPSCASQVTVPHIQTEGAAAPAQAPAAPLFERNDFDELFNPPPEPRKTEASPLAFEPFAPEPLPQPVVREPKPKSQAPGGKATETAPAPAPLPEPAVAKPGFWVTPALATLLSVAGIVALALAFAAGLLVGSYLQSRNHDEQAHGLRGERGASASCLSASGTPDGSGSASGGRQPPV